MRKEKEIYKNKDIIRLLIEGIKIYNISVHTDNRNMVAGKICKILEKNGHTTDKTISIGLYVSKIYGSYENLYHIKIIERQSDSRREYILKKSIEDMFKIIDGEVS